MNPPPDFPGMTFTNSSNAFAHDTVKRRLPATIRKTQETNPDYSDVMQSALDDLHDSLVNDAPIKMLPADAPDYALWQAPSEQHQGATWLNTDWFFAETYFYRLLIQAVRWWETGRDPFAPIKAKEYTSDALWDLVRIALTFDAPPQEKLRQQVTLALWGNRIDLSFPDALKQGTTASADDLLVDDSQQIIEHLGSHNGRVHIVVDNAGSELAMDLVLADGLLTFGTATHVIVHVKVHPTFVSDAIATDVWSFLDMLETGQHGIEAWKFGQRLRGEFKDGRLRLRPHFFWNSSLLLWEMPDYFVPVFDDASLVIFKGDANYRRIVGDATWPEATPFAHVMQYFPAPVVALRILKSDPVVGLAPGQAARLDRIRERWRVNGQYGVIQFSDGK